MATAGQEVELITSGAEQEGSTRISWAQNVWRVNDALSVRPGWGVEAELDTTLGMNLKADGTLAGLSSSGVKFGYQKHLGSAYIKASFGNRQIFSLFVGVASADDLFGTSARVGGTPHKPSWSRHYFARIFDLDTGRSWEEVLYHSTGEHAIDHNFGESTVLSDSYASEWHGNYETNWTTGDNRKFLFGEEGSKWFFQVYQNILYFGASGAGVFVYRPCDFLDTMNQQISYYTDQDTWRSEGSLVSRLVFFPGVHSDSLLYASNSQLSGIRAATGFRRGMAYATDNVVWFSDPERANNVIGVNTQTIPSAKKITALAEIRGNLIIFTESEMYFYAPSEGTIVSGGRPPIKVSENVGCVGPTALTHYEESVVWVSNSGVFMTSDGTSVKELSEPIKSFWPGNGIMTNPLTSYYEAGADGFVDISGVNPPRYEIEFDPELVSVAYSHKKKALLVGIPEANGCWAFTGIWSWWPTESNASVALGAPIVQRTINLVSPYVLNSDEDFFAVCGTEQDTIPDTSEAFGVSHIGISTPAEAYNYVICRLGRGGSLDRSSGSEDYRRGSGKYILNLIGNPAHQPASILIGKPYSEVSATGTRYWVPVEIIPAWSSTVIGDLTYYDIVFKFDRTKWDAEENAGGVISVRLPTERLDSYNGITLQVTENAGGVAGTGATFDRVHVRFDGASVANTWTTHPALSLAQNASNPLFYVSFKSRTTADSVSGFGIVAMSTEIHDVAPVSITPVETLVWYQDFIRTDASHDNDAKVQAVDWAYKGRKETSAGRQIRSRGLYAKVQSHGSGTTKIVSGWLWGVYNVLLGSDYKEYVSQIVDYSGDLSKIVNKLTIRSRIKDSAGNMTTKTFNNVAKWGSAGTPGHGNYLIDDSQDDSIAISDSVKGQSISYMVFGFIRNRAESFSMTSLIGIFRPAGGRRRTGR